MKQFFGAVALCALLLPSAVLAQSAPPMMPHRPDMATMRAAFQQAEKIRHAERSQILAALSPAHRQLLASIVGNMAIAANPDYKAAAARLDAALSTTEKNAVLAAHTAALAQMRNAVHAMMQKHENAQGGQGMKRPQWVHRQRGKHTPTAGEIVLMVTSDHGGPHGRMPFGPPPGMMMRDHNGPGMQGPPPGAPAPTNT